MKDLDEKLSELRIRWKKEKQNRKLIEFQAKLIRWAIESRLKDQPYQEKMEK